MTSSLSFPLIVERRVLIRPEFFAGSEDWGKYGDPWIQGQGGCECFGERGAEAVAPKEPGACAGEWDIAAGRGFFGAEFRSPTKMTVRF